MGSIASLFASLTLQSTQFNQGIRSAVNQSNAAASAIGSAMGRAGAIAGTALAGVGLAATAAFTVAAKGAFDYASSLTELALQTGTTVEEYQILGLAAAGAGAEQATLDSALKKLSSTLGEAKNGSKAAVEAFSAIGIKPDQLASLERGGDLFPMVAEGIKNVGTESERAAAAKRIFGKAAGELLPLLEAGAEGYNEVAKQAHDMGLITTEQAARSDEAADSISALGFAIKIRLGAAIADNIPLIQSFIGWIGAMVDKIASGLRSMMIFAHKAALVQNQFQTGKDAFVAFMRADNPIQGYRDAQASNARHRQRRDNLQRGLNELQNPKVEGIWDAKRGRWVSAAEQASWRGQVAIPDLDAPNLRDSGGGGGKSKPKGGGGGGGPDPNRAAKDMISDLKFEAEQLERNEREQEIYNNLKRAGVAATSSFAAEIRKLTGELYDAKGLKEYNDWLQETIENTKLAGRLIGLNDRDKLREETIQKLMEKRPKKFGSGSGEGEDIVVSRRPKLTADEQRLLDAEMSNFDKEASFNRKREEQEKYLREYQAWVDETFEKERAQWQEREEWARSMGEEVASIGTEWLNSMIWGTKSWKDALSDALKDLGALMIEELVMKPLRAMIVKGIANLLMNIAAPGSGNFDPSFLGADYGTPSWGSGGTGPLGMALGGSASAGRPYWVGEKGPELFTPGVNGSIIPNRKLGGGMTVVNHIDARGSTDEAATKRLVQEGIMQALPTITEAAKAKTVRFLQRPRMGG